jgi:hypothetical protein
MHIFKSEKNVVSEQDNTFSAFKGLTCAVRSNTTIWAHRPSLHLSLFYYTVWTAQATKVYPKVSGLATWSENCKQPLGTVVSLFYESV